MDGRSLDAVELRKLARIDNQIPTAFDPSWQPDEKALDDRVEYFQKISPNNFFQVVYDQGEIVGFHLLQAQGPVAQIITIWVHEKYRGQGIAKRLKELGTSWAREKGFKFLQTNVHLSNGRMAAINEKLGFKPYSVKYRLEL